MQDNKLFADRYRFISLIGKGGMGQVYLVEDSLLNEKVALKVIKKEATLNPLYVEKFIYEVKLTRKISHPNVVRTFDLGWAEGCLYYTMEYISGDSLRSYLSKVRSIPLNLILKFLIQITDGLSEIHKAGVIHRDLKPANIILTENLDCKIADFGIANLLTSNPLELDHRVYGSFGYVAPEIWLGKKPDFKSDLYSLGVIAYELCSGSCPFESESTQSAFEKHTTLVPRSLKDLDTRIPASLANLVSSMLEKNPDLRPVSTEVVKKSFMAISEELRNFGNASVNISLEKTKDEPIKARKKSVKGVMAFKRNKTSSNTSYDGHSKPNHASFLMGLVNLSAILLAFTSAAIAVAHFEAAKLSFKFSLLSLLVMTPIVGFAHHQMKVSTYLKFFFYSWLFVFGTFNVVLFHAFKASNLDRNFLSSLEYFVTSKISELLLFNLQAKHFVFDEVKNVIIYQATVDFELMNIIVVTSYLFMLFMILKLGVRLLATFGFLFLVIGLNALKLYLAKYDFTISVFPHASLFTLCSGIFIWLVISRFRFYYYRDYVRARLDPYTPTTRFYSNKAVA
ncbi:MAG: serine/threonine protein kinase [Deltaproteobacteria bacterium]|nr:serine/threonine protein kinase [Deltaproteobacteria bacterium]